VTIDIDIKVLLVLAAWMRILVDKLRHTLVQLADLISTILILNSMAVTIAFNCF
jgi:hypothetical protein